MNPYASMRAFTLIELIITVAIAAILLVIATPSFTNFAQKRAVSQKAVEIRGALELARGIAVAQHQVWTVCTVNSSDSCVDKDGVRLVVFQDSNLDNSLDSAESLRHEVDLSSVQIELSASFGRSYLRFSDSGETMESGNFQICAENESFTYGRRVIIFRSGRIRLTSDSDGDGFDDTGGVKIECHTSS